jgi:hypothetical protein
MENIQFVEKPLRPTKGSAGLKSQLPGCATTVGNLSAATGGIAPGNMVKTDK